MEKIGISRKWVIFGLTIALVVIPVAAMILVAAPATLVIGVVAAVGGILNTALGGNDKSE